MSVIPHLMAEARASSPIAAHVITAASASLSSSNNDALYHSAPSSTCAGTGGGGSGGNNSISWTAIDDVSSVSYPSLFHDDINTSTMLPLTSASSRWDGTTPMSPSTFLTHMDDDFIPPPLSPLFVEQLHNTTQSSSTAASSYPHHTVVATPTPTPAIVVNKLQVAPQVVAAAQQAAAAVSVRPAEVHVSQLRVSACAICHSHKVRCDGGRPCGRCIKMKRGDACHDRQQGAAKVSTRRRGRAPAVAAPVIDSLPPLSLPELTPVYPTTIITTVPTPSSSSSTALAVSSRPLSCSYSLAAPSSESSSSLQPSSSSSMAASTLPSSSTAITSIVSTTSPLLPPYQFAEYPQVNSPDATDAPDADSPSSLSSPSSPSSSDRCTSPPSCASSTLSHRSASRSPARKKVRPVDCMVDGVSEWDQPLPLARGRIQSSSSSVCRSLDDLWNTTPSLDAWSANVPLIMPPRVHLAFDESTVMRTALKSLQPWLHDHITTYYEYTEYSLLGPREVKHANGETFVPIIAQCQPLPVHTHDIYGPRLCPDCISPSRRCAVCTKPRSKPLSVVEWFSAAFFSSMWMAREAIFLPSRHLEALPMAGFVSTFAPSDVDMEHLAAHHYKMMLQISPATAIAAMAAAMLPHRASPNTVASTSLAPNAANGKSHLPTGVCVRNRVKAGESIAQAALQQMDSPLFPTSPPSSTPAPASGADNKGEVSKVASCLNNYWSRPIADGAATSNGNGKHTADVHGGMSHGMARRARLPDDFPTIPSFVMSSNDALEHLLGYTRSELKGRLERGAWKLDIPFLSPRETAEIIQHTFMAIIGLRSQWHLTAHVLHRSGVAIKCLIWGTMQIVDDYRTSSVFLIPLPGLSSLS